MPIHIDRRAGPYPEHKDTWIFSEIAEHYGTVIVIVMCTNLESTDPGKTSKQEVNMSLFGDFFKVCKGGDRPEYESTTGLPVSFKTKIDVTNRRIVITCDKLDPNFFYWL
jgi:hypothetical protein